MTTNATCTKEFTKITSETIVTINSFFNKYQHNNIQASERKQPEHRILILELL